MLEQRTGLRKLAPIEKASRLIREDRVMELADARVYRVLGDSGAYDVVASPGGIFCPCASRTPLCSHVLAVALTRQHEQGGVRA